MYPRWWSALLLLRMLLLLQKRLLLLTMLLHHQQQLMVSGGLRVLVRSLHETPALHAASPSLHHPLLLLLLLLLLHELHWRLDQVSRRSSHHLTLRLHG